MKAFGEALKTVQKDRKLTQIEMASLLGISQSTLSAYINDKKDPTLSTASEIAQKLGVSIGWLCGDNDTSISDLINKGISISYADVIRIINSLLAIRTYDGNDSGEKDCTEKPLFEGRPETKCYQDGPGEPYSVHYANFRTSDEIIYDYYQDYDEIKRLHERGTLSKKMYEDWISSKLAALKTVYVQTTPDNPK